MLRKLFLPCQTVIYGLDHKIWPHKTTTSFGIKLFDDLGFDLFVDGHALMATTVLNQIAQRETSDERGLTDQMLCTKTDKKLPDFAFASKAQMLPDRPLFTGTMTQI